MMYKYYFSRFSESKVYPQLLYHTTSVGIQTPPFANETHKLSISCGNKDPDQLMLQGHSHHSAIMVYPIHDFSQTFTVFI